MNILVLAEHDGIQLNASVYQAISAAQTWVAPVDLLIVGKKTDALAQQASTITGLQRVMRVDAAHLEHLLSEDVANIILGVASEYQVILAAHSSFSRNILPRVAALLDVAMIADVLKIKSDNTYSRSIYAGNVHATVQSVDVTQVLTVHASNFATATQGGNAAIVQLAAPAAADKTRWLSEQRSHSARPALSSAKVVISGGRSLGSAEKFEQVLSPLANKLGAALGATRAAVDAGYAPNDIQVGQTGVVVAPDLYIAIGVSGAIQHTYGMKDSKVVVAINQDPDASIFQVADYGLVADLFEAVPEMTASVSIT
ncbi:MAG: FAD-binding protein [Methylophilaceae bacterium]|nr:FAD-binding protein [Methylophilaceae bacterium]MDG1444764.1 FAD-binding protein [Methylophilaceae bacterium]MDG1821036.1 FAD-binding protein [Methylophilaceae bacterium]